MRKNTEKSRANKRGLPLLGDYSLRKEWEEACWHTILKSEELLQLLVTSHEKRDLVMRAAVMDALAAGQSQRQISRELFPSPQTINGVKKAMVERNYRSYAERSKKERKKKRYDESVTPKPKHRGRPVRTKYGTVYIPD